MGGYGSGERWRSKPKTDPALRLDVRWLARVKPRHEVVDTGGHDRWPNSLSTALTDRYDRTAARPGVCRGTRRLASLRAAARRW